VLALRRERVGAVRFVADLAMNPPADKRSQRGLLGNRNGKGVKESGLTAALFLTPLRRPASSAARMWHLISGGMSASRAFQKTVIMTSRNVMKPDGGRNSGSIRPRPHARCGSRRTRNRSR
jgi:hypothetical protein